jgi:cystathionine gamma-synthase
MQPETLVAQALHAIDRETGAVVPPVHFATTYARDEQYLLRGPGYTRDENPTPKHAERVLAALEGGAEAMAFSSGMAAATAVFRAVCRPGDHVIVPRVGYYNLRSWLERWGTRWNVAFDLIDTTDLASVRDAIRAETKIIWVETPANPTWDITDLQATAELAHLSRALLCVDSTCATPVHTQPIAHGADIVMHSATKFLGGHTDVLAGMLVTARVDEPWQRIAELRHDEGAVLGPMEAYLLLRGMRTLYARVERSSRTAQALAERLAFLPNLQVLYPGLSSHPHHAVAQKQMKRGFGSMLSIRAGGTAQTAINVVQRMQVWLPATSLGGVESLVEHRFTVEGPNTPTPPDLLRLSVGLEHEDDLFEDLRQALEYRS